MAKTPKIRRLEIDLSETSGYVDGEEDEIIQRALKSAGLFSDEFLYTMFNGDRIKQVETTGQYRGSCEDPNSIFAFTMDELRWVEEIGNPCDLKTYARDYENPAMIVYRRREFLSMNLSETKGLLFEYEFLHPERKVDAIEAIALIKMPSLQ